MQQVGNQQANHLPGVAFPHGRARCLRRLQAVLQSESYEATLIKVRQVGAGRDTMATNNRGCCSRVPSTDEEIHSPDNDNATSLSVSQMNTPHDTEQHTYIRGLCVIQTLHCARGPQADVGGKKQETKTITGSFAADSPVCLQSCFGRICTFHSVWGCTAIIVHRSVTGALQAQCVACLSTAGVVRVWDALCSNNHSWPVCLV